jgi:hypothetical protein
MVRARKPKLDPNEIQTILVWIDPRLPVDKRVTVDVGDLDLARAALVLHDAAEACEQLDERPTITVIAKGVEQVPMEDQ